jgi:hypothetical protein
LLKITVFMGAKMENELRKNIVPGESMRNEENWRI